MRTRRTILAGAAAGLVACATAMPALGTTSIKSYAEAVGTEYEVTPLFSVDDRVPETSNPSQQYRMVGVPDGLGAHSNGDGTSTLYMNHEFTQSTISQPVVGGPQYRGTYVSKWILDANGNPISGERAFDTVWSENTFVGPAAEVGNTTRGFARFCSGYLAGPKNGFDRQIYLTNEEEDSPNTFDGIGGLSVAIFDNEAHTLPKLGRYSKENTVVQPVQRTQTVIFSTEDGPATLNNQLYMYVGMKDRSSSSVLARNGLDNGSLFVFRSLDPTKNSERTFTSGSVTGEWLEIPNAATMSDVALEAATDAVTAMTFVRPEDGAFNPNNPNEFFFDTTGSSSGADDGVNELGRLYSLRLHPGNVLKPATLTIVYNADTVIDGGGDIAISPDNIDASGQFLMINEDGTTESSAVMAAKGRDGSIWRFDLVKGPTGAVGVDVTTATRIAELHPPGRDGVPVGPGIWETSGIIDASLLFGDNTWLSDVQAHSPTSPPSAGTVQDGQLFLLTPAED
jgi:secreted PhoX family phosphatase